LKTITKKAIKTFLATNYLQFKPTHQKLSLPIINRIYKKMANGIKFDNIKTCDHLIIDGHHRYVSSLIAKVEIKNSKYPKTIATIEHEWETVVFTETEWDTEHKIQQFNKIDAKLNNMTIERIIEIIK
jgi:hypothetical protein